MSPKLLIIVVSIIVVELVGLIYLQPLMTLTIGLGTFYSTGNVMVVTLVAVGIATVLRLVVGMVGAHGVAKANRESEHPSVLRYSRQWRVLNISMFTIGTIFSFFVFFMVLASFSWFAVEDTYGPFSNGNTWLNVATMLLSVPLIVVATISVLTMLVAEHNAVRSVEGL